MKALIKKAMREIERNSDVINDGLWYASPEDISKALSDIAIKTAESNKELPEILRVALGLEDEEVEVIGNIIKSRINAIKEGLE